MSKERVPINKTFKLYIGGKFPRTESGRYIKLNANDGSLLANICRGSKKDVRDAVTAARKGFGEWSKKTAYNRGQILYRIAETLEGRKSQFIATLVQQGIKPRQAEIETEAAIDRIVYYAGWTDKYQQIFSSVNPVESSHFNFSFPEPTGVVSVIAPEASGLLGFISSVMPAIAGGNTVIVLASEKYPLTAVEFAEVIHASDVSAGTINIITGLRKELITPLSSHLDINAVVYCDNNPDELLLIQQQGSLNVKRILHHYQSDWLSDSTQSPYMIMDAQEIKTTWHPVGI